MHMIYFALFLLSAFLFGTASFGVAARLNLQAIGLFCFAMVFVLQSAMRL